MRENLSAKFHQVWKKVDLLGLLDQHGIEYVTRGPNVARGNINVKCPFCRDDPSYHMGIRLEDGAWGCWRQKKHRGRSPHWLLSKLLGMSYTQLRLVIGDVRTKSLTEFEKTIMRLGEIEAPTNDRVSGGRPRKPRLFIPNSFRAITGTGLDTRYLRYLSKRGFHGEYGVAVAKEFRLSWAVNGPWRNRLVIPIYYRRRLVTWTGRALSDDNPRRYLALSHRLELSELPDKPQALVSMHDIIYPFDFCYYANHHPNKSRQDVKTRRRVTLFIVEGPMDSLKLAFFGLRYGLGSVCTFSTNMSSAQVDLIISLARLYKQTVVLLDRGAEAQALQITRDLASIRPKVRFMGKDFDDPGDMTPHAVKHLALDMLKESRRENR
jgi:hypothetical protein